MAFVEKAGSGFAVKQGNTGKTLRRFSTRKAADDEVDRLHRKNNPATANRGGRARGNQGKAAMRAKAAGRKAPTPVAKARKNSAASDSRKSRRRKKR